MICNPNLALQSKCLTSTTMMENIYCMDYGLLLWTLDDRVIWQVLGLQTFVWLLISLILIGSMRIDHHCNELLG
jgi:hypothetical protein